MFIRKDYLFFIIALLLICIGFILMAVDPAENGFGVLTLSIAPPLLLTGYLMPVIGIAGFETLSRSIVRKRKAEKLKYFTSLLIFLATFLTYLNTLEPTASLWDCSEFIACAYKLQVPHTPGTPLSLLTGRLFAMLAFGDASRVAWSINLMSAFFSAMTVCMVFYIIFFLGEKIVDSGKKYAGPLLFISSAAGSLCLAFSDTFWFSAVEAETYGPACFFLVLIVWLVLTGADLGEPLRSRRLVLIFYLAGLAYCIHPMCLLALSVLPFSWYTAGKKITIAGSLALISGGLLIIMVINRVVAVGTFELAFSFDRFFVNQFGFPFYSGAIMLLILTISMFTWIIIKYRNARAYSWSLIFLLLGFTPYLLLFIRSNHNPPIDEFSPENLPMIKAYMNREGYPASPLLYGPYFDASIQDVTVRRQIYYQAKSTYEVAGSLPEYKYDSRQTLLPRMYSNDPAHIETYREWTGLKPNEKPSFTDNIQFLLRYQLGHMYFRYLLWNFAGRQGEIQNSGWLKPWEKLSSSTFERARNQYWMIPLLVGLAGLLVQGRKDIKGFITMTIFFLITGIVLVLYLNSPPNEPRERDYIYVGSYVAFSIWIGLGLLAAGAYASRMRWSFVLCTVFSAGLPLWMLYQNRDDHDRSGRTFQVDNAKNILKSCAPNAILFTGGDNDTFPLWYVQEVEGFRTDVRVMVLSYMNTDWYINQLRKIYYDSGAFNLSLDENDYRQYGPNDVLYVEETIKKEIDVEQYLQLLRAEHPALKRTARNGESYHILPSRSLKLTSHKQNVSGMIETKGTDELMLTITENYISKNLLAILDLIVSNDWKRPIYFNFTSMNSVGTDLTPYLLQEGPLYRLTSERHEGENIAVDTGLAFRHLLEMADYSNLRDSSVHFNYEDFHARMLVPLRQSFNALALAFLGEGNMEMAEKVLREAVDKLYHRHLRPSYTNLQAAEILQQINQHQMAEFLNRQAFEYYFEMVGSSLENNKKPDPLDAYLLRQSAELMARSGNESFLKRIAALGI